MRTICMAVIMTALLTVVASAYAETIVSTPHEITLLPNIPTIESQLKTLAEKKDAELAALNKTLEAEKKALADMAITSADKDQAISALRAQAADSATKLATAQASVDIEIFRLLNEKVSTVKLRGFGSVQLIPLLNDYLVIIAPELAKNVDPFFSKIQKRIVVGKAGTYLICDRKYFVPAPSASLDDDLQRGDK